MKPAQLNNHFRSVMSILPNRTDTTMPSECRVSTQWKHAQASKDTRAVEGRKGETPERKTPLFYICKTFCAPFDRENKIFLKLSESAMLYFREVLDAAESKTQGQRNDLASKPRDPRTHVAGEKWLLKVVL